MQWRKMGEGLEAEWDSMGRWRMALEWVGEGGAARDAGAVVWYERGGGVMRGEECDGSASGP